MLSKRVVLLVVALSCLFALTPSALFSQTATTGVVTGTVTDPTGAVVPNATITLGQTGTGAKLTTTASGAGHYIFPAVPPGDYTLVVEAKGFRKSLTTNLAVEIDKSRTVDVKLEVGIASEVVEVTAGAGTELQTTDAAVGEVIGGEELQRLPTAGRSTTSLIFLQPAVAPDSGGDVGGGQVAGARSEQITFTIDGGDATSDLEGSNSYISPDREAGSVSSPVPVPQEATQEFRVSTSNPNSAFGGASGGQVSLLTKSGTNALHGSAYEYNEVDAYNANGWTRNSNGVPKPHSVDNRFGARVGGPIIKDKFFFSGFYEGRRFHDAASVTRVVPTDTLKSGILQFPDTSGNYVPYNFNPANGPLSTACNNTDVANPGECDPRGTGWSPVIQSYLALYPKGNDVGNKFGDHGHNTTGFTFNIPTPISTDMGILKLDYTLNSKWSAFVSFHAAQTTRTTTNQISFVGTPQSVSGDPYYSYYYTAQLQGQITPNFISVTHGSFLRNWWAWVRQAPKPLVSGTDSALEVSGEGVAGGGTSKIFADPININTQQARGRIWNAHDWYIAQDFTWIRGKHTWQFGGAGRIWNDYHLRTDDVLGGLSSGPIYYISSRSQSQGQNFRPTLAYTPTICPGSGATNCIDGSLLGQWNGLYASLMGVVDHSAQLQTRDGDFNPNPLGTPLFDKVHIPTFFLYAQDVFRVKPSLTITAGINWGAQLAPTEEKGKEVVLTYADTGTPVNFQEFFSNRVNFLGSGQLYNPTFGLVPVNHLPNPLHGSMRKTDWTDVGPRIAAAWQVPFNNRVFGDHKTVIRGGYALLYDRTSAVNQVLSPLLTGGLADVDRCSGPEFVAGGGVSCGHRRTNPTNAYRIGVDGTGPGIPPPVAKPIPFIPGSPFGLFLSAPLDPFASPGYSHNVDLTVQRALPHNFYVEAGYIGRFSRNLPQAQDLTASYYLMKDPVSGQTLVQAFDALAQQLRAGVDPSLVTAQPFFENLVGAGGTVFEAQNDASDLINGDLGSFGTFELNFDTPQFINNAQVLLFSGVTDHGYSGYNAGFLVLRKAYSRGLQFQFDWTWSHAIGVQGTNQQYIYSSNSPYNVNIDRASEVFDHKHVIHGFWYYDLPFGKGRRFASSHNVLDRVIGGWHTSGIYTYFTGAPSCVSADGDYGSFIGNGTCALFPGGKVAPVGVFKQANGALTVFQNPQAVVNTLSRPLLSQISRVPFDQFRGFPLWNVDLSLGKNIAATERFKVLLEAGAFNVFNHVVFQQNNLDLGNPGPFGIINGQANGPREMQVGVRFEF